MVSVFQNTSQNQFSNLVSGEQVRMFIKMRWLNSDGGHGAHESHVQGLRRFVMWIIERRRCTYNLGVRIFGAF